MNDKLSVVLTWEEWAAVCGCMLSVAGAFSGTPLGDKLIGLHSQIVTQVADAAAANMPEAPKC